MSMNLNSLMGGMGIDTTDPQTINAYSNLYSAIVTNAYNQAKLRGDTDQNAFKNALDTAAASGYFGPGVGNGTVAGQPTLANLQNTLSNFGAYVPGALGALPAGTPTQAGISQQQSLFGSQLANQATIAGQTGYFAQPVASQYTPGTVLTAPSTTPGMGPAYGIVNADGSVQMVTSQALDQYAAQRGTSAQALTQNAQPVDFQTLQRLSMGPPTGPSQQTAAYQQQLFNQAQAAGGMTGLFTDPGQTLAAYNMRGQSLNGQTFGQLPQDQQQYWLQYNQNNPTAAAQAWASAVNGAQAQAIQAAGGQVGGAAPTLQMQALYGSYGTPTQGQQTLAANQQYYSQWLDAQKQALAQWSAQQTGAQNYLKLLSDLRGPADYAKYQQVLGSTPGGMKDLVAAAAGQYIPGGGATTGVQPEAVNLQNFVGSATGQGGQPTDQSGQAAMNSLVAPNQMAPQTWNNLTPSQQQMLLGTWESQGYTKDDAAALFKQALPKYATQSSGAGTFRLQ